MNGLAVMLCVSLLGVQQTWRTSQEGQLEYVLQVEPTFLASLEQGESVTSNLPSTAKKVHRLCLRFSAGDLKKLSEQTLDLPPLATAEARAAKSELDIPVALVVDAQGRSEETTDVSHGWQATSDGRVKYLVQLAPDLLSKLREGDEIHMNLYPEATKIQQFIVLAGKNVLPRKSAKSPASLTAKDHKTIAPAAAEKTAENSAVYGPLAGESPFAASRSRGRAAEAPVVESRAHEPARLRNPAKYALADEPAEQPEEQPAEEPLYGLEVDDRDPPAAPPLFTTNGAEETAQEEQPEEAPLYGPATYGPTRHAPRAANEVPAFDRSQFDKGQFANAPINKPRTTQASLTPPADGNQYLPDGERGDSNPRSNFGSGENNVAMTAAEEQADLDNRTASIEPTKRRTGLSSGSTKSTKSAAVKENEAAEPATWGSWVFVCCALFMSIGGNLYLGWTAAEFYSRYRLAVERMRSSGRDTVDD